MANLQQSKANRIKVINSFPTSGMGKEGDIMIANISGKGTYLCTKAGMRWYAADRLNELGRLKTPKFDDLTVTSLKVNNLSIKEKSTGAEIDLSKGDFTLDVDGDIELNADGGNLTFKDDSEPILSVSQGSLTLSYDSSNSSIFDVDSGGDLTLDCSGDIELNADGGQVRINDGFGPAFSFDCDAPAFVIYDDANVHDWFRIRISAEAATTISTFDADSTVGHLTLAPDGDLVLDPASQKVIINATDKLYFDGGTETYIHEASTDKMELVVGGAVFLTLNETTVNNAVFATHLAIPTTKKLIFDGAYALGHTYIVEDADDRLEFFVGTDKMLILDEASDAITLASTNWIAGTVSGDTVTEFSSANSAYAGMILGYTRLEGDLTNYNSYEIQDAITVEDDTHQITFKTPPSEYVEIFCQVNIGMISTSTRIFVGLSSANATSGYAKVGEELEYEVNGIAYSDGEADDGNYEFSFVVSADDLEAVGASNTFWIGFGTAGAVKTAYIQYGLRASHGLAFQPFIIKATALPATIYDGQ